MAIKNGDKVKIEYTGTLDDGTVFDSTDKQGGTPIEFEVGSSQVIPGFEKAVIGMESGQEKEFKLEPKEAYGDPNPEMVKEIPRKQLPQEELKPGMVLGLQLPNGQQMPAIIKEIDNESATIDLNHPLAGQSLNFKIKVVQ